MAKLRERSMECRTTKQKLVNAKFNKTITKFDLKERNFTSKESKYHTPNQQFMFTQMGFMKKNYAGNDEDERLQENLMILERHRSKETLKKKVRKDKSVGKKGDN